MTVPLKIRKSFAEKNSIDSLKTPENSLESSHLFNLGNTSLETHIGSVIVLTENNEVLYATENLQHRLRELAEVDQRGRLVAKEIILICQVLKQCRDNFPSQNWAIEFDIFTKDGVALHIRSRWLKLANQPQPCILLLVEDRQQLIQDMVRDEAEDWGLTGREQEVWLLNQDGYTYRRIGEALHITINTVKKHMRSIYAKRKAREDLARER